ncbi:hypothetical protein [Gordonia soli]|nr:hypothetical protein [Gordonia soli]
MRIRTRLSTARDLLLSLMRRMLTMASGSVRLHRRVHLSPKTIGTTLAIMIAGVGLAIGTARADALHRESIGTDSGGTVDRVSAHSQEPHDARVIRLLTGRHPADSVAALPADFVAEFGYRPRIVDGYPTNPTGDGCSSPLPMPTHFEQLCRTHDFGYDVLRHAERAGHPLGGWARRDLDRMLADRMQRSCTNSTCVAAAESARLALAVNTWRQHDGPPRPEDTEQILTSGAARVWSAVTDVRSGVPA